MLQSSSQMNRFATAALGLVIAFAPLARAAAQTSPQARGPAATPSAARSAAAEAYGRAASLTSNEAERRHLAQRQERLLASRRPAGS